MFFSKHKKLEATKYREKNYQCDKLKKNNNNNQKKKIIMKKNL